MQYSHINENGTLYHLDDVNFPDEDELANEYEEYIEENDSDNINEYDNEYIEEYIEENDSDNIEEYIEEVVYIDDINDKTNINNIAYNENSFSFIMILPSVSESNLFELFNIIVNNIKAPSIINTYVKYVGIDKQDQTGKTLLTLVCMSDIKPIQKYEIISYLVNNLKANLNIQDCFDYTPLHYSILQPQNMEIVKLLLLKGADPNILVKGLSALGFAILAPILMNYATKEHHLNLIDVILKSGGNPNIGQTSCLSTLAAINNKYDCNYYSDIVTLLLEYKVDLNVPSDYRNWTPLAHFSRHCNTEDKLKVLQMLLEHGANPNITNYEGWTPLMHAARYSNIDSNIEAVKLLLQYKADINIKTACNFTALLLSTVQYNVESNPEVVKLLLNAGADKTVRCDDGFTVMENLSKVIENATTLTNLDLEIIDLLSK
jgi:uncharacterized protein